MPAAGLRPSEACNVRRPDSVLGPGMRFEMRDGQIVNVIIDLREEKISDPILSMSAESRKRESKRCIRPASSGTCSQPAYFIYFSIQTSKEQVELFKYGDLRSISKGTLLAVYELISYLSIFSGRISFQLVEKSAEIKLIIISDNLRNFIDGISCCFK